MPDAAEELARLFHETYEQLAPQFGYQTRKSSAKPWAEVPGENKRLMIATVQALVDAGAISLPRRS